MSGVAVRSALVTGAGRGLGASIAHRLAADGWLVAVNDIDRESATRVASEIVDAGGRSIPAVADVTDKDAVQHLVAQVESVAPLGAVVLNATGPQPNADFADTDWTAVSDELRFFAKSPLLVTSAAVPIMAQRSSGRIVHIDSEVTSKLPRHRSPYVTAKAAQLGLMRATALEVADLGITVNAVAPGFIPVERHADLAAAELDAYRRTVPVGRLGQPEDVAAAVGFLVSDDARFITGQRLVVDGGRHLT